MSTRSIIHRTTFTALTVAGLTLASAVSAAPKKAAATAREDAGKGVGGVYYLTEAVSVTTDAGIAGEPAGTKVTRVGSAPGGMRVKTADGTTFNVTSRQVTDDAAKGAAFSDGETARQAAIAAQLKSSQAAAQAEEAEKQRAALQAAQASQAALATTAPAAPAAATFTPSTAGGGGGGGGGSGIKGSALDEKPRPAGKVNPRKPQPQVIYVPRR